jgi:CBS domain-containing protein
MPMNAGMITLRVRRLRRVAGEADGTVVSTIFCPGQAKTMSLEACLECPRLSRAGQGTIECSPPTCEDGERVLPLRSRLGGDATVGQAAGDVVVCVHASLTAEAVARALREDGGSHAIVVDDQGCSVGVVHVADAAEAPPFTLAERIARRTAAVHEAAPLAHAVERMVRERARALPVTGDDGRAVALLTDVHALQWIARRPRLSTPA